MNLITKTIPEIVDNLIAEAAGLGASDIHIDVNENQVYVRYRIDGMLRRIAEWPRSAHTELIARIKVISGLRTDLHTASQDGRYRSKHCDIRVSIIPTQFGENAVLRILPIERRKTSLAELGFSAEQELIIQEEITKSHGMILVTGPTGSGKTSTQYAILSAMDTSHRIIVTLEDPIEYQLPGIRQIPINAKHGLSFAGGLRAVLRQDPDIIMVGEIRDVETAEIATHSALTGHLLVSTIHTNTAIDVLPRLIDMGIDPYLVASTLSMVINQRLVRRICQRCLGEGCHECDGTGYAGRIVIAEVLVIDEKLRSQIIRRVPRSDMLKYAQSIGMRTIYDDASIKVDLGITSRAEIMRVLNDSHETDNSQEI